MIDKFLFFHAAESECFCFYSSTLLRLSASTPQNGQTLCGIVAWRVKTESTMRPILCSFRPVGLQIFCKLAIRKHIETYNNCYTSYCIFVVPFCSKQENLVSFSSVTYFLSFSYLLSFMKNSFVKCWKLRNGKMWRS